MTAASTAPERSAIHIFWTEPHEEVKREPDGERWCFQCRKRRVFEYVVSAPVEMSYYGPRCSIECSVCHLSDGDLFPGRFREWGE